MVYGLGGLRFRVTGTYKASCHPYTGHLYVCVYIYKYLYLSVYEKERYVYTYIYYIGVCVHIHITACIFICLYGFCRVRMLGLRDVEVEAATNRYDDGESDRKGHAQWNGNRANIEVNKEP